MPGTGNQTTRMDMPEPVFRGPAYRIQTKRLVLRCWNPADAALLKSAIDESKDHLIEWMPWAKNEPEELPVKIKRMRIWRSKFDLDQDYVYGVFNKEESRVLGGTGLHTRLGPGALEIGYWIHKEYTHQGLATELSAALTRVAFEIHQVNRVEIHCQPENFRSAAVPRKLGFTHEATLHNRVLLSTDQLGDSMIWTLFAEQYPTSPAFAAEIEAFDAIGHKLL